MAAVVANCPGRVRSARTMKVLPGFTLPAGVCFSGGTLLLLLLAEERADFRTSASVSSSSRRRRRRGGRLYETAAAATAAAVHRPGQTVREKALAKVNKML